MPNFTERDGVRIFPDGREVCRTKEAWDRRRAERLALADYQCECKRDCQHHKFHRCRRPLALHESEARDLGIDVAHVHHLAKRGIGGGRRDDRLEKIEADCPICHLVEEERQRFGKRSR